MAKSRQRMSDAEIAAIIDAQINDAKSYASSELVDARTKALKYFEGEVPDLPAQPGRSKAVSRDVADTHGLIMPGLTRVFLASDNCALYEPEKQTDEEFAKQATDYVNYVVMRESDGYRQFRSAISDGLLLANGIVKHWWDPTTEYTTESFTGLSDDAFLALVADPEVEEVLEHTEYPDPAFASAEMAGQAPGSTLR